MRYIGFAALVLSLSAAVLPGSLDAQSISSPYRFIEERNNFSVFGGSLSANSGRLEMGPQPAPVFGARFDRRLSGPLSGELGFGLSQSTRTVFRPPAEGSSLPPVAAGESDIGLLIGEAGFRFHLTGSRSWRGIAPYLAATLGAVMDREGNGELDLEILEEHRFRFGTRFATGIGVGSDVFLTERFSLRVDARDHIWRLKYPPRFVAEGTSENEWLNNFSITLGGSFHF